MNAARLAGLLSLILIPGPASARAEGTPMPPDLPHAVAALEGNIFTVEERTRWTSMIADDVDARGRAANRRDSQEWAAVASKDDWLRFRDVRIRALRDSLGTPPPVPASLHIETTRTIAADGFTIECLVFESRPGLFVTANLYVPTPPRASMPGLVLCHSHHAPKTQDELQDMGANFARQGCLVLIMDQLGHGERRQQPFGGREDYRSRYFLGIQLHLVGESLMGWMVWDLARGIDLLLTRTGIDRTRILVLGSVAGGGDPAAVLAALDPRVTGAVPFNFGGPEPETHFPLPADADAAFNYAGSGSFESTRNLRLSARDGFLPWVIVAASAPRPLIYGHEFAWDGKCDPVWKRLQTVYGFYGAADRVASVHGWGTVDLKPPEASHCNNIGPAHRKEIYPYLERWFGISAPKEEIRDRRKPADLACLANEAAAKPQPKRLCDLAKAVGAERTRAARDALARLDPAARTKKLREDWTRLLGNVEPRATAKVDLREKKPLAGALAERFVLTVEDGIVVPAVLLVPTTRTGRPPVVVAVAHEGKAGFLKNRSAEIAAILDQGVAVCLPDVRGTGETDPGGDPGRHRKTVSLSSTDLMLGQTLLGSRLRDLRAVLRHLATRPDLDAARLALWGDSFTPPNPEPFRETVQDSDDAPTEARPVGGLLALLGGLFEVNVRAVLVRRGLAGFDAVLDSPFVYIPHDVVVPGALTAGDLADVAAALAPRPVRLEGLVTGLNIPVAEAPLRRALEPAAAAYQAAPDRLVLSPAVTDQAATWLAAALKL